MHFLQVEIFSCILDILNNSQILCILLVINMSLGKMLQTKIVVYFLLLKLVKLKTVFEKFQDKIKLCGY